tara:strand:+ start:739 stop:1146 length:408 start_codon:yes stop_codon:yes gene_type:complete
MKLITLLTFLISFNCLAQVKVEIIKANEATMSFEKPTLNKAVKHLKKLILSKRRFKGEWSIEESGNIFKRENMEGEFEYFKPSNFSINIEDVTIERAEKKAKKDLKAKNKKDLKELLEVQDLNLIQINKLLREMI